MSTTNNPLVLSEYRVETLEDLVKAINGLANAINSKVDNNVTMIQGLLDYLEGIDGPHSISTLPTFATSDSGTETEDSQSPTGKHGD